MGFDPYYQWLSIHPSERPADYYRLLGINRFESNPEVISHAADRVMLHVRTFQHGKHSADSQRILNELATASRTLLNPGLKANYDQELILAMNASAIPVAQAIPVARIARVTSPPPTDADNNKDEIRIRRVRRRRRGNPALQLLLLVLGPLLGLAILYYLLAYGFQGTLQPKRTIQPPPPTTAPEPATGPKPTLPPKERGPK
ncbi:MAG: hypothetical protein RIS70_2945 [Planctomycetota bacterium]|jgi:hypothetical protein